MGSFFPFRADPFLERAWCARKQTGSRKSCLPCFKWRKIYHEYLVSLIFEITWPCLSRDFVVPSESEWLILLLPSVTKGCSLFSLVRVMFNLESEDLREVSIASCLFKFNKWNWNWEVHASKVNVVRIPLAVFKDRKIRWKTNYCKII